MCGCKLCRCLGLGNNSCRNNCGCGNNSVAGAVTNPCREEFHCHCKCHRVSGACNNSVAGAETCNNSCQPSYCDEDSALRRCVEHCLKKY